MEQLPGNGGTIQAGSKPYNGMAVGAIQKRSHRSTPGVPSLFEPFTIQRPAGSSMKDETNSKIQDLGIMVGTRQKERKPSIITERFLNYQT